VHRSKIEWVLNPDNETLGWVWNPLTGCLNHINGLCKGGGFPCYAYRLAHGRLKSLYLKHQIFAVGQFDDEFYTDKPLTDPFYPRFWPERLGEPVKGYTRTDYGGSNAAASDKGIFTCDMSDLFGIGVPEEWTKKVLAVADRCYYHRFYLLTKQPQNLPKWSPFPDNCWVGVTATNKVMYDEALAYLKNIYGMPVKFISFEPLLESVNPNPLDYIYNVQWVIIGAQTKPSVYPKIEWVQEIVEAADKANIPVFLKDNLMPMLAIKVNGKWAIESHQLWAFKYFKLRQEMPNDNRDS